MVLLPYKKNRPDVKCPHISLRPYDTTPQSMRMAVSYTLLKLTNLPLVSPMNSIWSMGDVKDETLVTH